MVTIHNKQKNNETEKLMNNVHTMFHLECVIMYIIYFSAFKLQKKTKKRESMSFQISFILFTLIHFLYRRYLSLAFFLTVIYFAVIFAKDATSFVPRFLSGPLVDLSHLAITPITVLFLY